MFRRRNDDTVVAAETTVEREHVWASPPVVRGLTTLLGVAAAGFLVWLATQFDLGSTGEYWAAMGILVGAGGRNPDVFRPHHDRDGLPWRHFGCGLASTLPAILSRVALMPEVIPFERAIILQDWRRPDW